MFVIKRLGRNRSNKMYNLVKKKSLCELLTYYISLKIYHAHFCVKSNMTCFLISFDLRDFSTSFRKNFIKKWNSLLSKQHINMDNCDRKSIF